MGSLIATNLIMVMVIFLYANPNVSGEKDKLVCEYCNHDEGFPSKREGAKMGITIGICKDDAAPHNQKCSKHSDRCVSMKLKTKCSAATQKILQKYFPEDAEGMEYKGCWKADKTDEVKSMMDDCGGKVEFTKICDKDTCNKDEVVSTIGDYPVILTTNNNVHQLFYII